MARLTVYRNPAGPGYLMDVQADVLSHLNTRMVVPLLPLDVAPMPAKTLNPLLEVEGATYSMVTQFMAAIPAKALKGAVMNAGDRHDEVVAAMDLLFQGF